MKKIIIALITCIILCGCNKEVETIILEDYLTLNYGEKISLYDLIDIKEENIITENYQIDTEKLGEKFIEIEYKTQDKLEKHEITINIIDNVPPVINSSKNYYTEIGEDPNLTNIIFYGDNVDKSLECTIEGEYNITQEGSYPLKFVITDSSNNTTTKDFTLHVVREIDDDYTYDTYEINDVIEKYKNENTMIGIDVSEWQYDINWEEVKNSKIEFAYIRIGFGHDEENNNIIDETFYKNLREAKAAGIKVGVYFYSYALTKEQAQDQAIWIINTLNGETLDLPIAFDWENWSRFRNYNLNFTELNNIKDTFLDTIKEHGYEAMNYGSAFYLNSVWDTSNSKIWMAHYTDKTDYEKDYYIWQFTSNGRVPGIETAVDLNIMYLN